MRIKIKKLFNPIFIDTKIIFGMQSKCIEIENADDEIIALVKMLVDGVSINELKENSKLSIDEIQSFINDLDHLKILEDCSKNDILSKEEKERYKTNLNYFNNYADLRMPKENIQKIINNTKILILGVGGYSILAASLAAMGYGNITLVDYDLIELSNLSRQIIYSEDDIGKSKVKIAKKVISKINSNINIKIYEIKVESYLDIMNLVEENDIIINAIDTPALECIRWVNYCCVYFDKPFFQSGLGNKSIILEKYLPNKGCFDCSLIEQLENNFIESKEFLFKVYSEDFDNINTAFASNILMSAGLLGMEITKYVLGTKSETEIDLQYTCEFYPEKLEFKKINIYSKKKYCPTCYNKKSNYVSIHNLIKLVEENGLNK